MENIEKCSDLLPCPFCGGEASQKHTDDHLQGQAKTFIECDVCNARTDWQYSRTKLCVDDWWNQRTEPADNIAEVGEMEGVWNEQRNTNSIDKRQDITRFSR